MTIGPEYRGPGSGYTLAKAGRAQLLVSQDDRDRAADFLNAAFAEGRLSQHEHDSRLSKALTARTYADLDALTADLPGARVGVPRRTDGMAIGALICGVGEFFTGGLTAVPAVVLGHLALRRIRRTGDEGRQLATIGLVFGWIGIGLWVLFIGFVVAGLVMLTHAGPHPAR